VRVAELMRRLDSRVLPPLARALARLGRGPARTHVLTGVALFCATVVLLTAVWAAELRPPGDDAAGAIVAVGVRTGDSADGYEQQARAELQQLTSGASGPAQPYALVSFGAYLAPDRLRVVLHGSTVSEIFARVPLREMKTQIVRIPAQRIPEDVVAGMELFAERKVREAAAYQAKAAQTSDQVEREGYGTLAAAALAEATAYRSQCSCVYAAVVRAAPAALGELAARPGVRSVDPAPEVQRLDHAVFRPPLPEQLGSVTPFAEPDPRSTPPPAGASATAAPPVAPAPTTAAPTTPAPPVETATTPEPSGPPPSPDPEPSATAPSPDPSPSVG
jgi:hypothetical protein